MNNVDVRTEPSRTVYPRTYRVDESARRWVKGFCSFMVLLFALLTPLHLFKLINHPLGPAHIFLYDMFVVAFAVWLWSKVNERVTIYDDAIVVTSIFGTRRLRKNEIQAYRLERGYRSTYGYVIIPAEQNKRALRLPTFLAVDSFFHDWMSGIPSAAKR